MTRSLTISAGQYSDAGAKPVNQDFHGLLVPTGHQLVTKGIAVAIADGISSSNVSQIASESAVAGFLSDYFSTPESWLSREDSCLTRAMGIGNQLDIDYQSPRAGQH